MDIRVMVASEVRLYRDALQSVLRGVSGIALVGVASSAEEIVEQSCMLAPSVAVVDMAMIESFSESIARAPQVGGVLVFGIPEVPAEVIACLPSGILGFVSRDGTVAVLLDAIRAAGRVNPPQKVFNGACIDDLTTREMEILRLMQEGVSNKTVSRHLGIELSTVKNHVHSILAKLGVHRRGEAISLLFAHEIAARGWDLLPPLGRADDNIHDERPPEAAMA
jgi:two-component system nitrate/nitrite response regulator NarL